MVLSSARLTHFCERRGLVFRKLVRGSLTLVAPFLKDERPQRMRAYFAFLDGDFQAAVELWESAFGPFKGQEGWQSWDKIYYFEALLRRYLQSSFELAADDVAEMAKDMRVPLLLSKIREDFSAQAKFQALESRLGLQRLEIRDMTKATSVYTANPYRYSFVNPRLWEANHATSVHELNGPASEIRVVDDVSLVGAFQLVKRNALLIYEPASHPKYGLVAGVCEYFTLLPGATDEVVARGLREDFSCLRDGILLSGRATTNYFHWLIEYIPKLYEVAQAGLPLELPLIVQSRLPSQFREILRLCAGLRPVIEVDPGGRPVFFRRLHVVSLHTFIADSFDLPYWQCGAVSHSHLQFVRNRVLSGLGLDKNVDQTGRKIYLQRSGTRSIENAEEVETLIIEFGFELMRPESLSFADQIKLFQSASMIVAPSGAALANLIFCEPGTKVIALTSERNADFPLYANLAAFSGCEFVHVTGPNVRGARDFAVADEFVHSSYLIDTAKLRRCITQSSE